MSTAKPGVSFDTRKEVDFVIIGSGASGGVLAKELSTAGFDVVVLEQGPYRTAADFSHDEIRVFVQREMTRHPSWDDRQTFRHSESEKAVVDSGEGPPPALYARGVGGSSVHFTANYWRLRPLDFNERSLLGEISGTGFADWPISYDELEPYYSRVDWEIGVSGAPGPFDGPRSRPFPPHSSIRRPADRPSASSGSGFLKMQPEQCSVTGWFAFFSRRYALIRPRTASGSSGSSFSTAPSAIASPSPPSR